MEMISHPLHLVEDTVHNRQPEAVLASIHLGEAVLVDIRHPEAVLVGTRLPEVDRQAGAAGVERSLLNQEMKMCLWLNFYK